MNQVSRWFGRTHRFLPRPLSFLLLGLVLSVLSAASSFAGEPVRELRWGGDGSGGEPYIIKSREGPPTGFEGDLAVYLGKQLGLPTQFHQGEWDQLPSHLERGDINVILNGYEWTPARAEIYASTIPYYAYRLRLVVRKDSPIRGWADLGTEGAGPKLRVGVLKDSAGDRYLRAKFPHLAIEALGEEGTTGVMNLVRDGALQATVQDLPAVVWYLDRRNDFPTLHAVGEAVAPVEKSYYVMYVRKNDSDLRDRLDQALRTGLADGSLKKIYEKYGLWDADQEQLAGVARTWSAEGSEPVQVPSPLELGWALVKAAGLTVLLACASMPLAIALGLVVAVLRLYGPAWLSWPAAVYVEVIRGTPILMQLFAIYFLLPSIGITLSAFTAGVLGLTLNYGAYEAENYRAGLLGVPRGQMEAALSLGMSRWAALVWIIVPQAVRLVIPPVTNDFISLFKDTSACIIIGVAELTSEQRGLMNNHPQQALLVGLMTAVLYLLMSYPLSVLARRLEKQQQHVQ
jgi:polar amino acid transport system substrate-binding protein